MYVLSVSASSLELNAMDVLVLSSISDWEELGHQLQVCPMKMSQLVQYGGDPEHCREEVVQEWLKEDKSASWEKLCRALERMGNVESVQFIKERYISNLSGGGIKGKITPSLRMVDTCSH